MDKEEKLFKVTIEETITDEFEVFASNIEEAGQIAIDKYYNGEILLEPGHLVNKKLFICDEDTNAGKGWMEF